MSTGRSRPAHRFPRHDVAAGLERCDGQLRLASGDGRVHQHLTADLDAGNIEAVWVDDCARDMVERSVFPLGRGSSGAGRADGHLMQSPCAAMRWLCNSFQSHASLLARGDAESPRSKEDGMNSLYELLAARALREVPELPRDFDQKLRAVTDELGGMSESALLQFFLTPKPTLGRETPLETLLFGSLPRLIAVARVHAGSGAPTQ